MWSAKLLNSSPAKSASSQMLRAFLLELLKSLGNPDPRESNVRDHGPEVKKPYSGSVLESRGALAAFGMSASGASRGRAAGPF